MRLDRSFSKIKYFLSWQQMEILRPPLLVEEFACYDEIQTLNPELVLDLKECV